MSLWKRAGCQTESKTFEKSIEERIVREPGLGVLGFLAGENNIKYQIFPIFYSPSF